MLYALLFVFVVTTATSATALDDRSFNQLRQLMIDGCSLGMETNVQATGDGNISIFRRSVAGSFSFKQSELPAIIAKMEEDTQRRSIAFDTRECMERLMNRLFDAVLNQGTQGQLDQPEPKHPPANDLKIALAAATQMREGLEKEDQLYRIAYAAMCRGEYDLSKDVVMGLRPGLDKENIIYELASLALCDRQYDFAYGMVNSMREGLDKQGFLRHLSEISSTGRQCIEDEYPPICAVE